MKALTYFLFDASAPTRIVVLIPVYPRSQRSPA